MRRKDFIITSFACFSLSFAISLASLARWDSAGLGSHPRYLRAGWEPLGHLLLLIPLQLWQPRPPATLHHLHWPWQPQEIKPPHQSTPCSRKPNELLRQSPNQHGKHHLGYRIYTHSKPFHQEGGALHRGPNWPVVPLLFAQHPRAGRARGARRGFIKAFMAVHVVAGLQGDGSGTGAQDADGKNTRTRRVPTPGICIPAERCPHY